MRPPTDCLSPIGEEQILAGLKKEIHADFLHRGDAHAGGVPRQSIPGRNRDRLHASQEQLQDDRLGRTGSRPAFRQPRAAAVPGRRLRDHASGDGCELEILRPDAAPRAIPVGPVVDGASGERLGTVHVESKDAIASYAEILEEVTLA